MQKIVITLDIDWAPDWMISHVADLLKEKKIKATWFATHRSAAIDRIMQEDQLFEVGVHPNFEDGSTQGDSVDQVLTHIRNDFPSSELVRTHSLYQSEKILQKIVEDYKFTIDCSIYLKDCPNIVPHEVAFSREGPYLTRIPHVFQDNMHMNGAMDWSMNNAIFKSEGLKVLDFHPVHIILNSTTMVNYQELKDSVGLLNSTPNTVNSLINRHTGAGTFFLEVVDYLSFHNNSITIGELVKKWKKSK